MSRIWRRPTCEGNIGGECVHDGNHMTSSCNRALHRGAEHISREEHQTVAFSIVPQWPLISEIVEHGSPLGHVNGLWRFGLEFERLHTIDIVEMQDVEGRHTVTNSPRSKQERRLEKMRAIFGAELHMPSSEGTRGDHPAPRAPANARGRRQSHAVGVYSQNRQRHRACADAV